MWLEILVAYLETNFQDLVAKVKNLVALAPVLGAILRPAINLVVSIGHLAMHWNTVTVNNILSKKANKKWILNLEKKSQVKWLQLHSTTMICWKQRLIKQLKNDDLQLLASSLQSWSKVSGHFALLPTNVLSVYLPLAPHPNTIGSLSKSLWLVLIWLLEVNFPKNGTLRMYVSCIQP